MVPVPSLRSKFPYWVFMLPPMVPVSWYGWVFESAAAMNSATVTTLGSSVSPPPPLVRPLSE